MSEKVAGAKRAASELALILAPVEAAPSAKPGQTLVSSSRWETSSSQPLLHPFSSPDRGGSSHALWLRASLSPRP